MTTMPALNHPFEVVADGDPAELGATEFLVLDIGRDPNGWTAAASYAVCGAAKPFAAVLAKRLLSLYPVCRDREENEKEFLDIFDGPPEASPVFEFLRRLADKAPAPVRRQPSPEPEL